jgi:hypothetical protein
MQSPLPAPCSVVCGQWSLADATAETLMLRMNTNPCLFVQFVSLCFCHAGRGYCRDALLPRRTKQPPTNPQACNGPACWPPLLRQTSQGSDRHDFIKTLAEACKKTDWQVHAHCLMRNHYHLVLETPNANLVAGMAWLQSTYTIRLNNRHKLTGHVLSGRYKAQLVEGSGNGYLQVITSILIPCVRDCCCRRTGCWRILGAASRCICRRRSIEPGVSP